MWRKTTAAMGAAALALTAAACGSEETGTTSSDGEQVVRIGYIPGPAPAMNLLLADERGYFADEGIDVELTPFQTGISLSNALTGGSIDVGVMGAVVANFPARGQGKLFLLNNLEADIQQIWAAPGSGIESVADLAGRKVATTTGSAAHLLLHVALKANDVSTEDVEVVNLDMPAVANTFVTGGVPAAALWAPFDTQVEEQLPDATLVSTSADYEKAAIAGGWVANNDYYADNKDALGAITRAWLKSNADLMNEREKALNEACPRLEKYMSLDTCIEIFGKTQTFTNDEWATFYEDGTALDWVGRMEQVFVDIGALPEFVEPENFFDTSIYQDAVSQ
ncbi:NitT/TauT family transport system substrate-binding protein [Haloactinopolyspora alba]|uniref:NitT/TauT family transport system substrate-binding protein n=1 Tax=Haloactinopolyspora alba TaxID=648780 RepID=A0A2P8E5T6_9ACTN|nr:ABC transporter substrate-binding protein [Haloactinopolyspora alba]PSL04818.1 NitT/TauT family transport system substrate-binding protein [Haloactinopolyspora alba]